MSKKSKIGVTSQVFLDWGGGVDLIVHIANAISLNPDLDVYFLAPDTLEPLAIKVDNQQQLRDISRSQANRLRYRRVRPKTNSLKKQLSSIRKDLRKNIKIVYFRNTPAGYLACLRRLKLDAVLPTTASFGRLFPVPWVGYIWDFQHKHFPEFFSNDQLVGREKIFKATLREAPSILVNSEQIKKEAKRYYGPGSKKIVVMPFSPSSKPQWFSIDLEDIKRKYDLPKSFLLVSNQFWLHKDHSTVIDAMAILSIRKKLNNIHLICTGKMEEPRKPGYIKSLRNKVAKANLQDQVHFLGYVPKDDQIGIMRQALAVVQPTLYEGGRGGGAASDAISLGVPLILSDIDINREIEHANTSFFKAGSAKDLAKKIEVFLSSPIPAKQSPAKLLRNSQLNHKHLCEALTTSVELAIKAYGK